MTQVQREQIITLREQGYGYKKIGNAIGLTKDQVYSFCRNNGLTGNRAQAVQEDASQTCPCCGSPLIQTPGRKMIRFCSKSCRITWWNTHPEAVNRKAIYPFICQTCGKPFTAYGNNHRKYCSRECYIQGRFKGGVGND